MSEWISVDDRLPESDDEVLIWPHVELGDWHYTAIYEPWKKDWVISFDIGGGYSDKHNPKPTHWMPLPEPPIN